MAYTKELIDEVKELYPNSKKMIKHAEDGSECLGRYLDDSSSTSMSLSEIYSAKSLNEIKDKANIMQRKVDLYHKWCEQDPRKK